MDIRGNSAMNYRLINEPLIHIRAIRVAREVTAGSEIGSDQRPGIGSASRSRSVGSPAGLMACANTRIRYT